VTDDGVLWRDYRRTRLPALRDELVERHLGLVKYAAAWVAGRLPRHLGLDDLYAAGLVGFLAAVEDYDPDRGVAFSGYATPRIRGAIFDELRRLDCVPRRVRRRLRDLQRAVATLTQRLDRDPTEEEIARHLQIDVDEYRRLLGEGLTLTSLDALADDARGSTHADALEDTTVSNPLSRLEANDVRRRLGQLIDRLPPRDRQVLALYYYEELTMHEIGRVLGVTESRVSQIHSAALVRLRVALGRQRLRAADFAAGRRPAGRP
jgi:RNA polymerase sigma factor for flagellar operon FliA